MVQRLILVPTTIELEHLAPGVALPLGDQDIVEICGFGMVAAAARTAQLLAAHQPRSVDLLGIAGGYDPRCIGQAYSFDHVTCVGIGAGNEFADDAKVFQSAGAMGWPHFEDEQTSIGDQLMLGDTANSMAAGAAIEGRPGTPLGLLTVASASASTDQARRRHTMHPDAIAEDMEGFAVAAACRLANVPLRIVRGISNRAGDRDFQNWKVSECLRAVTELLRSAT